jgi:hypothetical protein
VIRAATEADLPALVELVRRAETALFGAPEQDAAEITERIRRADPLAERSRLSHEDGRVLGAAWCSRTEAEVTVDPEADPGSVLGELVAWLEEVPAPPLAAADRDAALLALLQRRGWRVDHVSYDLSRDVGDRGTVLARRHRGELARRGRIERRPPADLRGGGVGGDPGP